MASVLIVGGSIGGIRTAQALRREQFAGDITIVSDEHELPYNRPPLSKEFLATGTEPKSFRLPSAEARSHASWRLRRGVRARNLDVDAHRIELDTGETLAYDTLVVATGAAARPLSCPGSDRIHLLRNLEQARRLRQSLEDGGPLVVAGAGFIGCEVAATARRLGVDVTLVEPAPGPMNGSVGPQVGQWFAELHRRHGVVMKFGRMVERVDPGRDDWQQVTLDNGEILPAKTVLAGIGAVPNDAWLASSGLTLEDGLLCDRHGQAVGAEDIFALGDVARYHDEQAGRHIRDEHWTRAVDQAAVVAHNIAHPEDRKPCTALPYVWSNQYDWKIQLVGRTDDATDSVTMSDPDHDHRKAVLYEQDGTFVAAVVINWPRALLACRQALLAPQSLRSVAALLQRKRS